MGGCISRAQDVKQLNTSEKAFYGLRLDYKPSNFTTTTSDYFIRFTTSESQKIGLPTAKLYPNTGHGFTSGSNGNLGVPELEVIGGGVYFREAAIYRRLDNGEVEMIAVYNSNTDKFSKIK